MGLLSTILGVVGFGFGSCIGVVIGYFFFIFKQPSDVKVCISLSQSLFLISFHGHKELIFDD